MRLKLRWRAALMVLPAAVGVGLVSAGAPAAHAAGNPVNLVISSSVEAGTAGGGVKGMFTVVNKGSSPTQGELTIKVVTPVFINFDTHALPPGCSMLLARPDPDIPEIVDCRVPAGLVAQQRHVLELPMIIVGQAPPMLLVGNSIVAPVPGSPDTVTNVSSSIVPFGVQVSQGQAPSSEQPNENRTNEYVWTDNPQFSAGMVRPATIHVGNRGAVSKGTFRVTYTGPFFVNFEPSLPPGCSFILRNVDPTVPEVVGCEIPAGLGSAEVTIQLPMATAANSPGGFNTIATACVLPAPDNHLDIDTDLRDNNITTTMLISA